MLWLHQLSSLWIYGAETHFYAFICIYICLSFTMYHRCVYSVCVLLHYLHSRSFSSSNSIQSTGNAMKCPICSDSVENTNRMNRNRYLLCSVHPVINIDMQHKCRQFHSMDTYYVCPGDNGALFLSHFLLLFGIVLICYTKF